jgi:hypothetical protein
MSHPPHPPWFNHPNNIRWRIQAMKSIIMKYSSRFVFLPFRSKYQHSVLKHPQSMFLPQSERPSFAPIQYNWQNRPVTFEVLTKTCFKNTNSIYAERITRRIWIGMLVVKLKIKFEISHHHSAGPTKSPSRFAILPTNYIEIIKDRIVVIFDEHQSRLDTVINFAIKWIWSFLDMKSL